MERSPGNRILARCDELARVSDEPGRITRSFLSPAMERVNARVAGWMAAAGMRSERDDFGNLIATLPSPVAEAPVLVLGSHLDTVRDAGRYDGVLGVLLAVAVAEALADVALPFDLEIVAFADEEGLRFGAPFLGSRAMIGDIDDALLERRDDNDISIAEAVRFWGGDPEATWCRYSGRRTLGYVEAHIEQGPVLEQQDQPLGVLDSITGAAWLKLCLTGRAGHAGTTPIKLRQDALAGASELVLAAERLARQEEGLVATVGQLNLEPGASNVIPGEVELSLDVRHADEAGLERAVAELVDHGHKIAHGRRLRLAVDMLNRQPGAPADARLSQLLDEAVAAAGIDAPRLVIGAGHDAMIMARIMPMAMLMIRSPGGVSHHPDETVLSEDVAAAFGALVRLVTRLAEAESGEVPGSWNLAEDLLATTTSLGRR